MNSNKQRKIFLDCGAYNGCSIKKFKAAFPDFECFSFEPNPLFHGTLKALPTTLIPKAVWSSDGTADFYLDTKDYDCSSVFEHKKNIIRPKMIEIQTINLSDFITSKFKATDIIFLKLDIEGAEYEVLNHLLETRAITYISELLIEWHYKKTDLSEYEHNLLIAKLRSIQIPITKWDAITSYTKDIEYLKQKYPNV